MSAEASTVAHTHPAPCSPQWQETPITSHTPLCQCHVTAEDGVGRGLEASNGLPKTGQPEVECVCPKPMKSTSRAARVKAPPQREGGGKPAVSTQEPRNIQTKPPGSR